ncbi:uncharacterized protein C19orf47 homolog [Polypterus senegalus]|uniref:uncharacterized protein C19orf47 homolog n=1 Tax=Polypterus senegalus TaxID=55291 RepID=UPI0019647F63|nr:uncharacterized protein C19orf47 homolog [Polypterus senegalus]
MASVTTATSEWIQFFKDAGIPPGLAVNYAVSFVDNRIQKNMLMDLSKEIMMDLGITVIGDIIAILKHAKVVYRQDMCKMATEAISVGQSSVQAELRRTANTPASRMIANSLSRESPPGTPVRRPDNRLSVTVSNKQAAKIAKTVSKSADESPEIPVKRRRVTAEMEGKYIINMPKGTTAKTKKILEMKAAKEKGVHRTSVFERLGAESKADTTTGSKPTGVFSRLGDATRNCITEEEEEAVKEEERDDNVEGVQSDEDGSVLQYAGVLKKTPQAGDKLHHQGRISIRAAATTSKSRTVSPAANKSSTVTIRRLSKPVCIPASSTSARKPEKPEPPGKISILKRLGKPPVSAADTQDSRVTSSKSKGFTVTISRGTGSAKVSSSTATSSECLGAQMDSMGSVSVFKRLGLKTS